MSKSESDSADCDTEEFKGVDTSGLDDSPIAMVITDPHLEDNPIVYVNDAFVRLTGYSRQASCGRNCRFLQGENTDKTPVRELRDAIEEKRSSAVDIVNYTADGREFMNSLVISPIHDDEGVAFYLGIQSGRLETDRFGPSREELQNRLTELQHRVKNHLSMILSMIRQKARDVNSSQETIALLATRVESIAVLYDYISYAEHTSGDRVPLGAYVSRVCAATQSLSDMIAIRVNIETEAIMCEVERAARVGLVVSELLNNAFQHAFEGDDQGEINVELSADKGHITLTVEDNGKGMDADNWPENESLGSRIVKGLSDALDGEMQVQSSDGGTRITLRIPESGPES